MTGTTTDRLSITVSVRTRHVESAAASLPVSVGARPARAAPSKETPMADSTDLRKISQRELEEYLDALVHAEEEDSPEFRRAFRDWGKNQ